MTVLAQDSQGSPLGSLVLLVPLVLAFYFVGIRPNRRRMQEMRAVQSSLAPGAQVVTTAGLYATVRGIDDADGTLTLEIAPGVEARFARGAVLKVVEETSPETLAVGDDE